MYWANNFQPDDNDTIFYEHNVISRIICKRHSNKDSTYFKLSLNLNIAKKTLATNQSSENNVTESDM